MIENDIDAMHSGKLYLADDERLQKRQRELIARVDEYNLTRADEAGRRAEMLSEMFAEVGERCWIEPPFHSSWGGAHVHFGSGVYANFNLTLIDDTHIYVGDRTMFGPNVTLVTAAHPIDPELREKGYEHNEPVRIGRNCWLGAGVTVCPGVTIGDNTVIGAGAVVTRDIPANVVAYGVPCRVAREIDEHDRERDLARGGAGPAGE